MAALTEGYSVYDLSPNKCSIHACKHLQMWVMWNTETSLKGLYMGVQLFFTALQSCKYDAGENLRAVLAQISRTNKCIAPQFSGLCLPEDQPGDWADWASWYSPAPQTREQETERKTNGTPSLLNWCYLQAAVPFVQRVHSATICKCLWWIAAVPAVHCKELSALNFQDYFWGSNVVMSSTNELTCSTGK